MRASRWLACTLSLAWTLTLPSCATVGSDPGATPTTDSAGEAPSSGAVVQGSGPGSDADASGTAPRASAATGSEAESAAGQDELPPSMAAPEERFPEAMFEPVDVDATLDASVRAIVDRPPFDQMFWGIHVRDMHDGAVLYERNPHRRFVPASNMKVLVSAAALAELGPDYRFETSLWTTRAPRGSTVNGPLVLDGRGDPTLSDRFRGDWRTAVDGLADLVVRSGVRHVAGPLIIDASRWDSTSVPETWMVGDVGWAFAASGGPFVLNEGQIRVEVLGGNEPGDAVGVRWDPDLGPERLASDVVTGTTDSTWLRPDYRSSRGQIVLSGFVPARTREVERLAVRDPVRVAGGLLLDALRFKGVRVDGGVQFVWEPGQDLGDGCLSGFITNCATAERVARLQSVPLSQIVPEILGPSQNWITEQVVRALGAERGARGSWEEGLGVVERVLTQNYAVLSRDLELRDGSGLSAYNLVTPRALTTVLFNARIRDFGDGFREALASPGERGTTLSRRLSGMEERVFAKTGTITHVSSLSGYLVRDNGRELVFSILVNASAMEARDVRPAIDELVRALARF